jgi:hypothetical protein
MSSTLRFAARHSAHHELLAALGRVALVLAVAAIAAAIARLTMGPPLF